MQMIHLRNNDQTTQYANEIAKNWGSGGGVREGGREDQKKNQIPRRSFFRTEEYVNELGNFVDVTSRSDHVR